MDTEQTERPRRIHGRAFLQALTDAGVIRPGDFVQRVIIDANVSDALRIYVQRVGDTRALEVAPLLAGLEIREVPE